MSAGAGLVVGHRGDEEFESFLKNDFEHKIIKLSLKYENSIYMDPCQP